MAAGKCVITSTKNEDVKGLKSFRGAVLFTQYCVYFQLHVNISLFKYHDYHQCQISTTPLTPRKTINPVCQRSGVSHA